MGFAQSGLMVTDEDIAIGHRRIPALSLLRDSLKPHSGRLIGVGLLMAALGLLPLLPVPWALSSAGLSVGELGRLGIIGTSFALAYFVAALGAAAVQQFLASTFERELRGSALRGLHEKTLAFLDGKRRDEWLAFLTDDLRGIENFLSLCLPGQVRAGALFLGSGLAFFTVAGATSLLPLLAALGAAALIVSLREKLGPILDEYRQRENGVFQFLGESLQGGRTIRAFAIEPFVERQFEKRLTEAAMGRERLALALGGCFGPVGGSHFAVIAALSVLSWQFLPAETPLDRALLHPVLLGFFYLSALALVESSRRWKRFFAQAARLSEIIYAEPSARPLQLAPRPLEATRAASLDVQDLELSAGGVHLGPFGFRLSRGGLWGVVGPSNAGKSDFLEVLAGLREARQGKARISDVRGERLWQAGAGPLQMPTGLCALVEQKPYFFKGTLRENLIFANPNRLSDAVVWEALEVCNLHHFLRSFGGLDFPLEVRGKNLNESERVRVALCRALLQKRPFLLLDEPFAFLDEVAVGLVISILEGLKDEKGIVVATQHLPDALAPDSVLDFDRLPVRDVPRRAGSPLLSPLEIERHVGGQRMSVIDEV